MIRKSFKLLRRFINRNNIALVQQDPNAQHQYMFQIDFSYLTNIFEILIKFKIVSLF
jgi:hypothetical protein